MTRRKRTTLSALAAIAVLGLSACSSGGPSSEEMTASEFYAANSTISVAGGHDAGSGFDFYMRAVAASIERVSELSTTVENIPGGGGLIGDNTIFTGDADGLTVGLLNYPGHVFAQLTENPSVEFDFAEWEWLGRVASGPPVILVSADSPYKTAEDLIAAEETVTFGIEGAGSDAFYGAALAAKTFGFPGENVTGYEGTSDITTAILRGEVDATFLSYGSARESIETGEMRALMIFDTETREGVEDIPLAVDFALDADAEETLTAFGNIYSLERVFVAAPGTPADRVEYLRDILLLVFEDPEFLAEIEEAGRLTDPLPGAEVESASNGVAEQADVLSELLAGL
ncbi:MAG: transporter solute receptor, family [Microbacteriaceae bacterium]|nr:transporter solute receptor, family [Microbacteriaceae bacterium]HEV7956617.1 tripartite tricarboxylate transporter substrate-binding protein [Marisediminicola sp.]